MGRTRIGQVAAAAAVLLMTVGCGMFRQEPAGNAAGAAPVAAEASAVAEPTPEATTPEPEPTTASPSPSASRKKASKKAKPTPTEDPNHFTPPLCADYEGKAVSKAKVRSALLSAAGRTYWPGSAPKLKVPARLVIATAWHESGWQSHIVNCDGGRGLMQVMPDTADFVNQRFEKSYDVHDYKENAVLGANYLAWLTKAFGDDHFKGNYDLSAKKCKSHSSTCLLNMVIAGYNTGRGSVDEAYAEGRLPNPEYVDSVRSLMKSCYCDRY
jgi:soluble lytic murein transglycosylase-like protein